MLAPARMPVAEGKKIENMPKKLPSAPRQLGTKLSANISAVKVKQSVLLERSDRESHNSLKNALAEQIVYICH